MLSSRSVNPSIDTFEYPWALFRVVMEGASILDTPKLELKSLEEATSFVRAYGYDVNEPEALETIWGFFEDAVAFIEKSLADPRHPRIPEHLRSRESVRDVRRLLLLASENTGHPDQMYACGILRVMHVLIHLNNDPRLRFFDQVQNQVFGRLDEYLYVDPSTGVTYLGARDDERNRVKLLFFKKKDRKDREREIIKLLHKTDSLVEEIYDRIGFRLVTETKYDAIRAVRLLLERNIISVPNLRPGRSRNRLVNLKRLIFEIDRIAVHLKKAEGDRTPAYVDKLIRRLEARIGFSRLTTTLTGGLINPHSSEHYRAIQFTCRELVKVRNPQYLVYERARAHLSNLHGGGQAMAEIFPQPPRPFEYTFFPYEIQIMDVKAYADSIFGKSNHEEYRRKQLEAARGRVFASK